MFRQISASAGSGKTYTLTKHFISLLEGTSMRPVVSGCALFCPDAGYPRRYSLPEILAATFTNKAAAEMKTRVVRSLKSEALAIAQGSSSSSLPYEKWLATILQHYSLLNIRTIDSLLSHLVRLSALELGLPPDFQTSFKREEFFEPIYDRFMADLASYSNGEELIFLTAQGDILTQSLEDACATLVRYSELKGFTLKGRLRDQLYALVSRRLTGNILPEVDVDFLHKAIGEVHKRYLDITKKLLDLLTVENLSVAKLFISFLNRSLLMREYEDPLESVYVKKESLDDCLNKASKGKASNEAYPLYEKFKVYYNDLNTLLPLLKSGLRTASLVPLANELYYRLLVSLQSNSLLPAICLPVLASKILDGEYGVSDALCRMGTQLTHLLLDEFQDTSVEQWAAILPLAVECLAHGGSLTYVGDVKQAIYSWRGGEARLFQNILQEPELLDIAPDPVQQSLPFNWRSWPAIVRHNNAFFSLLADKDIVYDVLKAMLPEETPDKYLRQAVDRVSSIYTESEQYLPEKEIKNNTIHESYNEGNVSLYTVKGERTLDVEIALKFRLKKLLLEDLLIRKQYSDITILIRSGSEEQTISEWLTEWGIPVVTENSFLLGKHPLISRLLSFLTFIDYPFDDLAFWEFISGEECFGIVAGSSRGKIQSWFEKIKIKGQRGKPLFQLFQNTFPEIWKNLIGPFYNQAGLMSAYDMLREVIRHFDLFTKASSQAPFLQRFLEIAYLAENRGMSSLSSFLDFWKQEGYGEKLPLPDTMDAVRIMTIHKAKGLEFPVVILPFHHRGKRHTPGFIETTYQGQNFLTIAGKSLPEEFYSACITDELERLNLLYVAWTRPVEELHAFITDPAKGSTPLSKGLSILLGYYKTKHESLCSWEEVTLATEENLEDIFELESTEETKISVLVGASKNSNYQDDERYSDNSEEPWRPMSWLPKLKIFRTNLEDPYFSPRQRGILMHLCLESLFPQGLIITQDEIEMAVQSGLRRFPLFIADEKKIASSMIDALSWFSGRESSAYWLTHGLREQSIVDEKGDMYRVDLLVHEGDCLRAIDYKSGSSGAYEDSSLIIQEDVYLLEDEASNLSGQQAGDIQIRHNNQVKRYMHLLQRSQNLPVKGTLVYLDERQIVEVVL